jgi:hypothetical protein
MFVFLSTAFSGTEHQFDVEGYTKIVKKTIGSIISGNCDADKMIGDMEQLVELGIAGCKEHMGEAETPETEVKMMEATIENAKTMSGLSLDEIEAQWHEGGFLKEKGIDIAGMDHFDEAMCHYDAVVHPATAIICLKEYKKTNDETLLDQVKDELAEVKEHLAHLE